MSLGLQVELFHALTVVHRLWVNLRVTENHTLPNGFIRLLESQIQELLVFYRPQCLFSFDLLTKLAFKQGLLTAFDLDLKVLRLVVDNQLLGSRTLWQLDLNIDVFDALGPVILICRGTVVSADFLVDFELLFDYR